MAAGDSTRGREARPFLKWAGGKSQLLDKLTSRLPERFRTYHEPFVGGGALFFRLWSASRLRRAHLSDANPHLIQTYEAVRDDIDAVIERLGTLHYEKEEYDRIRATDPESLSAPARAARFVYLNRTCFNGLYRENSQGKFNVPMGRYQNPTICQEERLRAAAEALREVELHCEGFEVAAERTKKGDAVYFDPPYVPLSQTSSFTAYHQGGFQESAQRRLARVFTVLAGRGVHVILSNSDTPLVRDLYRDHEVTRVSASRRINSKAGDRGEIFEVIVTPGETARGTRKQQIPLI